MSPQLDLFQATEPRPLAGCVTPAWQMYFAFQRAFSAAIDRSVARHGRRKALRAERTAILHASLKAGRAGT